MFKFFLWLCLNHVKKYFFFYAEQLSLEERKKRKGWNRNVANENKNWTSYLDFVCLIIFSFSLQFISFIPFFFLGCSRILLLFSYIFVAIKGDDDGDHDDDDDKDFLHSIIVIQCWQCEIQLVTLQMLVRTSISLRELKNHS